MSVKNLEAGVKRAVTAYLKERGDKDAESKAVTNLPKAVAVVTAAYGSSQTRAAKPDKGQVQRSGSRNPLTAWHDAFIDLKKWTLTTIPK